MPEIISKNGNRRRLAGVSNMWIKALTKWIRANLFLILVFAGAVFGVCSGAMIRATMQPPINPNLMVLVGFPGEIFLRVFKLLLLPLVVSSIAIASSSLNAKTCGKMAAMTLAYFMLTNFASAIIGLVMALVIHPGQIPDDQPFQSLDVTNNDGGNQFMDAILDLIRNMLPENIIQACLQQIHTDYTQQDLNDVIVANDTGSGGVSLTLNETLVVLKRTLIYRNQANYLGLIVYFFVFGLVLSILGEKAKPLANIFAIIDSVILYIITKFTWFTPVGVASLICERVVSLPKLDLLMSQLAVYFATVIATLCVHIFIFIPLVYVVIVRKNPFLLLKNVIQALFAGFATDSSAIVLPLTFQCMEQKMHVDSRVTGFVLPMGVTINMNGTAAFLALASVFLAQMSGVELTFRDQLSIVFSATLISVATVPAPSASLFLLSIVTTTVHGINGENISLLFAVDFLLSRCRTISNVLGDCCGATVVQYCYQKELKDIPLNEIAQLSIHQKEDLGKHHFKDGMETFAV